MQVKYFLIAFFLVSVKRASAGTLCTSTTFDAAALATCDCPIGTGPTGSWANNLVPVSATNGVALPSLVGLGYAAGSTVSAALELAAANAALARCVDLMPGYQLAASTALPVLCADVNTFCPGLANAFSTNVITTTGADGTYSTPVLTSTATITGGNALSSPVKQSCPTNTAFPTKAACTAAYVPFLCCTAGVGAGCDAVGGTTSVVAATFSTPYLLNDCSVTSGYYISAAATASATTVVSQWASGSVCVAGATTTSITAEKSAQTPTTCAGQTAFMCALGTFSLTLNGHAGVTLAIADAVNEVVCTAGKGLMANAAATACVPMPGFFGAGDTAGTTQQGVCPQIGGVSVLGIGSVTSTSAAGGCNSIAAGYYLPATTVATGVTSATVTATQCPVGSYCPGITSLPSSVTINVPWSTAPTLTTTANLSSTGSILCPTGFTSVAGATAFSGCNAVAAGYYIPVTVSGATVNITICPAGSYCAGVTAADTATANAVATFSPVSAPTSVSLVASSAVSVTGLSACPASTTGTLTGKATYTAACTDLAQGYGLIASATSKTTLTDFISACVAGVGTAADKGCAGLPGLFSGSFSAFTGTGLSTATAANYVLASTSAITTAVTIAATGTNVNLDCIALTYSYANTTYCYVSVGNYVDASAPGTVATCPAGFYCPGGAVFDGVSSGGALTCPPGSTIVSTTGAITLNSVSDCIANPGYYIATTGGSPTICPAGYICPGGIAVGVAGGSFQCTANSTIALCNDFLDNIQSSSYAAGSTTVTAAPAAAAPAVTVSPAAVTVTPAPITVTPAPITVTTAPVTVTPAPITVNVPAPVSAASTRSSALVLVLAAFAALAAF